MATPVRMPLMGTTMEEGIVSKWLVEEGAEVKRDQPILEFETDKINAQVEAPADGILGGVTAREGDVVPVLGVLAYILAAGEAPPEAEPSAPPVTQAAASPPPQAAPPPTPAPPAPIVQPSALASPAPAPPPQPAAPVRAAAPGDGRLRVSPLARRVARELGVNLARLTGSGPGGRIIEGDVRAAAVAPAAPSVAVAPPLAVPAVTEPVAAGATIPLEGVRRIIAERMTQSLREAAQLTMVAEADATRFSELRNQLAEQYEKSLGFRVSYNDLLIRICARALQEHPRLNASLAGNEIRLLDTVNVGLAVETDQDLVVPNVKDVARKSLVEIATDLRALVDRARGGGLTLDDITGGTFTITNLGLYGVDAFTPIINPPEAAILGVGAIRPKPAVVDGAVVPRDSVTLSLTIDHRIVDGAPGARFLQRLVELIEQPYLLL